MLLDVLIPPPSPRSGLIPTLEFCIAYLRYTLRKKLRDYLGIFQKFWELRRPTLDPMLGKVPK